MPKEFYKEKDVKYICSNFTLDGKNYKDDLGDSMPIDEFFDRMKKGAMPTTSQINEDEYSQYFRNFLEEGLDILHICLSGGISGTVNSLKIAVDSLIEEYPDRKILFIDSLQASMGFGLLADMLADKKNEGASIDELYDYGLKLRDNINAYFFSTDLSSYLRGGRISKTAFTVGKILNICPLIYINAEGKLIPIEKVRTKKKVMERIVEKMQENALNGTDYDGKCFISHSACYEDARKVADMIEERFPKMKEKVRINSIGTVIGAHTGVGTVAVFFVGGARK
jgi:hypothetical protein